MSCKNNLNFSIVLLFLACFTCCSTNSYCPSQNDYDSENHQEENEISSYENRIREQHGWQNITLRLHEYPKVCDDRLGCIQLEMPVESASTCFKAVQRYQVKTIQFLFLPFAPEKMQTKFIVYRAANPEAGVEIVTSDANTFVGVVDPKRRVVVLTHGFTDHYHKESLQSIKRSLLMYTEGEVGTVIMVDWHKGSYYETVKNFPIDDSYSQAVANIQVLIFCII